MQSAEGRIEVENCEAIFFIGLNAPAGAEPTNREEIYVFKLRRNDACEKAGHNRNI